MHKPFIWLVFYSLSVKSLWAQPGPAAIPGIYTIEQLQEDWDYYRHKLESLHPNQTLYLSKPELTHLLDSLRNSLITPMTELEFYKHIAVINQYIRDGHSLILPSKQVNQYHNSFSKFWPIQLAHANGVWVVTEHYTEHNQLPVPIGANILQINGLPMFSIWNELLSRQVRDGHNLAYAEWVLQNYFREYYSYLFGHPKEFEVTYSFAGKTVQTSVQASPKDSLLAYRQPSALLPKSKKTAVNWTIDQKQSMALLTIKTFHRQVLRQDYRQQFKREIRQGFRAIRNSDIQHLVLDLRDNQGGDLIYGVYLLAHLLDKPFKIVQNYQKMNHGELVPAHGPCSGWHKPKKHSYTGGLDVWLNGGSFSNSVIVASCLEQNNRANFYGSESGGNPHILAGNAKSLTLPHTKIRVDLPTKRFILTSLENNTGRGILPNHRMSTQNPEDMVKLRPSQ